jgi:xanthine dehydrogenase YagR molybdenum-binding subunit
MNHNAIEPHATTLAWRGDNLEMHDAVQGVAHMAASMAAIFAIPEQQVHVTAPFIGGGFGGKVMWQHQVLGAAAARLAGRPVRMALSREGVYRLVGGRAMTEQRVAIGASADGGFDAIIHAGTSTSTKRNQVAEAFVAPTMSSYAAGNLKLDGQVTFLDLLPNTQMRAPGGAVGSFALESAVDELAAKIGMDPIALRLRNEPVTEPASGKPFSSRHIEQAWREGARRFNWSARNPVPGAVRDGEWLVGVGCAASSHPYVRMPGGAARMTLSAAGQVTVGIAAHEMGMGTSTVQTQIIAQRLGVGIDDVSFAYGDSALPGVVLAGGSQQTASIGAAVVAAFHELVSVLLHGLGSDSPLAGLKPHEVHGRDGGLAKMDDPALHESYASLMARAGRSEITVEAQAPMPFEMMHWAMHSHGAMFCEVRVNAVTGEVRIARFLGYFDCGRIMNAKTAASQLRGGIIMGIGMALMEETQYDERSGRIMNPNLSDYHVPVHLDVPQIDVAWTDIPDPRAPMGARGIGELGITGTGAAIANAIFNATGKRIRTLPIRLDQLL